MREDTIETFARKESGKLYRTYDGRTVNILTKKESRIPFYYEYWHASEFMMQGVEVSYLIDVSCVNRMDGESSEGV